MTKNLEELKAIVTGGGFSHPESRFKYPPAIAKTLGFKLTEVDLGSATIMMEANLDIHANPMGTLHGGVLCDLADLAIGTAHASTLQEGESFTSIDLQINFFRPVFKGSLFAKARPVHSGKTVSRYVCEVLRDDGKLVAQVTSTVMTLAGNKAEGR
jgi:uncharacterized protein (TIGR00369 family)